MSAAARGAGGVSFVNATIKGQQCATLRVLGSRIASINEAPLRGDIVVDLQGDRLLPGLINAHDHLQFNNSPPLQYRVPYRNASEWIADVNARTAVDAALAASVAAPRARRFLTGGLKNLLSGVTTVAHHDPCERELLHESFPTRVVAPYGWSHSLFIDADERVRESYAATPATVPWIIHAGEGIDDGAAAEFDRLRALGCIGGNTLLVHGVAFHESQRHELAQAGGGLIWCPSSNLALFGRTADVAALLAMGRVALGSDSRLTAAGDLLDELRVAHDCLGLDEITLERLVTSDSARLLRVPRAGVLEPGAVADLMVMPAGSSLARLRRNEVRLVVLDGLARYGDSQYAAMLAPPSEWAQIRVDGRAKSLRRRLAALLASRQVREPGVILESDMEQARCG
jgi:cytosine/adenosine deaminase-related metal-dependent hydrolase